MSVTPSQLLVVLGLPGEVTTSFHRLLELCGAQTIGSATLELGHKRLLTLAGTDWQSVSTPSERWFAGEAALLGAKQLEQELASLSETSTASPIRLLNEPGMERVLPIWQQAMNSLSLQSQYILLLRHPLEVVAELKQNWNFSRDRALMIWLRSALAMEGATRNANRCVVDLAKMYWDPDTALDGLEKTFPILLPERNHDQLLRWERENSPNSPPSFHAASIEDASPLLRMALELHCWLKAESDGKAYKRLMPEVICEQLAWAESLYGRTLADEQQHRRLLEQELLDLKSSRLLFLRRLWHRQNSAAVA